MSQTLQPKVNHSCLSIFLVLTSIVQSRAWTEFFFYLFPRETWKRIALDRTDRERQDDTSLLPTDFSNTQRSFLGRCLSILRSLDNNHLEFILNIFSSHTDRTLVPHCSLLLVVWLSPCYCLPFLDLTPAPRIPPVVKHGQ